MRGQDKQVRHPFVFLLSNSNPLQGCKGCFLCCHCIKITCHGLRVCAFFKAYIVSLECFISNPPVNTGTNCITVNPSAVCTPQVSLPLKKWEVSWLGQLSAVPVPETTFLKGLYGTWSFNSVVLPKTQEKKTHKLLHYLGWSHGGIPAGLMVTQAENRLRKGLRLWDTLQFLSKAACAVFGFVYSVSSWHWAHCHWSIPVLVCLDTRTQLPNAGMSIKPEAFLLYMNVSASTGRLPNQSSHLI